MSIAVMVAEQFGEELNQLMEKFKGHTDGVNIADELLRATVRQLKLCAGHKDDSRSAGIREMIEQARNEVVMATYPLPITSDAPEQPPF
jgi:hypothetical protein